jgi:hypothetical protein
MRIRMKSRDVTVTHLYGPAFENKCRIAEMGGTETWQNTGGGAEERSFEGSVNMISAGSAKSFKYKHRVKRSSV